MNDWQDDPQTRSDEDSGVPNRALRDYHLFSYTDDDDSHAMVLVAAATWRHALEELIARGMNAPKFSRTVRAGEELPKGLVMFHAASGRGAASRTARLEDSDLIRHPLRTITLGVFFGLLLFSAVSLVVSLLFPWLFYLLSGTR